MQHTMIINVFRMKQPHIRKKLDHSNHKLTVYENIIVTMTYLSKKKRRSMRIKYEY
jgi:hypothetical protein